MTMRYFAYTFFLLILRFDLHMTKPLFTRCALDILRGTKNINKIVARFDLDNVTNGRCQSGVKSCLYKKLVFYKVKFCKGKWMCFATTIDEDIDDDISNDIAQNVGLWTKLLSTMMGHNNVVPYSPMMHGYNYGIFQEYHGHPCFQNYYIIREVKPSTEVREANKTIRSPCIRNNYKCTRTCHSSDEKGKCHEVRLLCSFGGCRKKSRLRS